MSPAKKLFKLVRKWFAPDYNTQGTSVTPGRINAIIEEGLNSSPNDYPVFPPVSPIEILKEPEQQWMSIQARKFAAPRGVFEDTSLYALYRLYEGIILDKRFAYRNMLEIFWRKHDWLVCDIPDPQDDDPARYAVLAGITYLIARSFNARVAIGLTRGAAAIMLPEEIEAARNRPEDERPYEEVPLWAKNVAPVEEQLVIPTEDGDTLGSKDDSRADKDFSAKNILIWTPHIHFS